MIRHTATAEECAVATAAALDEALQGCSALLRDFLGRAVRAEASERAGVAELLAHPFVAPTAVGSVEALMAVVCDSPPVNIRT